VVIVGEIMEVSEAVSNVTYKIDDRTGPWIDVKRWMDEQDLSDQHERASCREGMYVKVIGHLKQFNKLRNVVAFKIRPVEDYNEVTHHLAEVMYCHLASTKSPPLPPQYQQLAEQKRLQHSMDAGGGGMGGAWESPMATSTQNRGAGYGSGGRQTDNGMNRLQQQVLNAISSCVDDQGVNINNIISNVSSHGHPPKGIREAVEFLCNEGHIYSTIDDDHFKSTDA
jgi:replication factor A2